MKNPFGVEDGAISKGILPVRNKGLKMIASGEMARKTAMVNRAPNKKVTEIRENVARSGGRAKGALGRDWLRKNPPPARKF